MKAAFEVWLAGFACGLAFWGVSFVIFEVRAEVQPLPVCQCSEVRR